MPRNQDLSSRRDERDYNFDYTQNDEGDSSVRAGAYDQGRQQHGGGRDSSGQSGSTGRRAGWGGRDTGQGQYGQSGYGQGSFDTGRGRDLDYDYGYGRQGGYGGDFGRGVYGEGGSRSRFSEYGDADQHSAEREYYQRERAGGRYAHGTFGTERSGWNDSQSQGRPYDSQGDNAGSWNASSSSAGQYGYGSRGQGQHRGKGPKGYQRSDDRLKEIICERLADDPDIDASEISVSVSGGRVTLEGSVDSRRTKNLAEDVAEQFGIEVHNNLRVQRADAGRGAGLTGENNETSKSKRN